MGGVASAACDVCVGVGVGVGAGVGVGIGVGVCYMVCPSQIRFTVVQRYIPYQ